MEAKAVRTAFFLGVVLALWTFARPAHAMGFAPFCDDRGATALAPPPVLDASGEQIGCPNPGGPDVGGPALGLSFAPGHRRTAPPPSDRAAVRPASTALLVPAPAHDLDRRFQALAGPHGVHFRIERPPRA
jgi:hypothetical protein